MSTQRGGGASAPGIWSLSKKAANYRHAANSDASCGNCRYMFPRLAVGGCRLVRGLIRNGDTCDQFTPRQSGGA